VLRGSLSNAEAVVAGLRPGFRACYTRGLDKYPDAEGRVRLVLHVGPNGEVTSVDATGGTLPAEIVGCMASRARLAQFTPPEGGSAAVVVPVMLDRQD
jgi:hypothetical protein